MPPRVAHVVIHAALLCTAAGSLGCSAAMAAPPALSNATLVTGMLTIGGSNFGPKLNPAPFFHQPYLQAIAAPDADLKAGYSNQRAYSTNAFGSKTSISSTGGWTEGRGALTLDLGAGAADYFPHIAVDTSNTTLGTLGQQKTDELYISYWIRLQLLEGAPSTSPLQIKSVRAGSGVRKSRYYSSHPLFASSLFIHGTGKTYAYTYQETRDSTNVTSSGEHFDAADTGMWNDSTWNFVEVWMKMNTPGLPDGFFRYRINGVAIDKQIEPDSRSAVTVRGLADTATYFDFAMLVPGVDVPGHTTNSRYRLSFSDHYIDVTPQRVMLGNAATYAAATAFMVCPAASWSDSAISAQCGTPPSSYRWIYVSNAKGEINAVGYKP